MTGRVHIAASAWTGRGAAIGCSSAASARAAFESLSLRVAETARRLGFHDRTGHGDLETAARGSPASISAACFAALLGGPENGR